MGTLKRRNFAAPNPTITESFCGTDAGFYISAALCEAVSIENLTMIENIKYKTAVQRLEASGVVANSSCDFSGAGVLALTERNLEPKNLQVNIQICKTNLLASWEALQMRAGAWNNNAPRFEEYVISLLAKNIADSTEKSIWQGATLTAGEFEGFTTAATGTFANDGSILTGVATTPFAVGNIIANLDGAAALVPNALFGAEDLRVYMNYKTYRIYLESQATAGYQQLYNMNDAFVPMYNGIRIALTCGMLDDQIVIAERGNLFFGTDLLSDTTEIRMLDMAMLDGSNNLRAIAKYSGGVQHGVGADIVWWK
mgnify:FL=1